MTHVHFLLAVLGLLLTPGPTNTLLAVAGAASGARAALRLVPLVVLAYLATTVPLALAGQSWSHMLPSLRIAMSLAAAAWVAYLAVRLWRMPAGAMSARNTVTAGQITLTTLLNPKALIIGLVLLPGEAGELPERVAILLAAVMASAALWASLGAIVPKQSAGGPGWLRRLGAMWLMLLSAGLASAGLSA